MLTICKNWCTIVHMFDLFLNKEVESVLIVKCPHCGGQLHVDDDGRGVCATCGKAANLPKPTPTRHRKPKEEETVEPEERPE